MNVAFTLCSINYLAQAKVLFDSLRESNPGWHFIVGLVDKNIYNIDLSFLKCEVITVEKIPIEGFDEMVNSYSIVELITSVKPFYFLYLLKSRSETQKIIYFDPDIIILNSLLSLESKLDEYDIILTPHFTTPIRDSFLPTEKHVFRTGVFNLGFLAVKRSNNTLEMLKWWGEKLRRQCFLDLGHGLFVDQLWMNLVPAYFEKVLIDKDPGYNMAHWNLHERTITETAEQYLVNGVPLVFYHFSHFHPDRPQEIAAFHTRYSFATRPDLRNLFDRYTYGLISNKYLDLNQVPCYYMRNERKKKMKKSVEIFFRNNLPLSFKMKFKTLLSKYRVWKSIYEKGK